MTQPIIKQHDMASEMFSEAVELITMAVDKHAISKNYEAAAGMIKITFDKKFGNNWHVIIGEGFGFEISYQQQHLLYVFIGTLGVLCYKM
ncbi:dynein light chain axonemal [Nannochloropsis gaditana]|uniref:Dynein light chain n=1 Tax=Nannochloropsis gaditana TaxID=72520 RepID=W7U0Y2_9STRA|nr:dynein light chain axonemal [Nannochloropsis gaditana]